MAWTVGPMHTPPSFGRFFGPKYFAFHRTDHLPAVPQNAFYQNFYKELGEWLNRNDDWNTNKYLFCGFGTPGLTRDSGEFFPNWGHAFNSDEMEPDPYPLRHGSSAPGHEAAVNLSYPTLTGSMMASASPNAFDMAIQDFGPNPSTEANDNHLELVSQRSRCQLMFIGTHPQLDPLTGSRYVGASKWMNKRTDGSFCYDQVLNSREVFYARTADSDGSFPRFIGKAPIPDEDHPYGTYGVAWDGGVNGAPLDNIGDFGRGTASRILTADLFIKYEEVVRGRIPHMLFATTLGGSEAFVPPVMSGDGHFKQPVLGDPLSPGADDSPVFYDGTTNTVGAGTRILPPKYGWIARLSETAYGDAYEALIGSPHVGATFAKVVVRCLREFGVIIGDKYVDNRFGTTITLPQIADGYSSKEFAGFPINIYPGLDSRFPLMHTTTGPTVLLNPLVNGVPTVPPELYNIQYPPTDAIGDALANVARITMDSFEFVDISSLLVDDIYSMEIA